MSVFNLQVSAFLVKNSMDSGDEINADSDEHKKVMLSIFEHEDKNGDGVISIEEFSGPKHDELQDYIYNQVNIYYIAIHFYNIYLYPDIEQF